jgi:N-acetylmuramoyl-L-alanine amidase
VEIAFLSSPAQAKLARSDEFKEMTAQGLYDAIAAFRRQSEEPRPR